MKHTGNSKIQSFAHEAMACQFGFHLFGERSSLMDSAVLEAEELLDRLEERLSLYIENSDTSRINRAKTGETILVSDDTVDCLLQAFDASARLNGKFHPFMGRASIESKQQNREVGRFLNLENEARYSDEPVLALDADNNAVQKLREGPLLDLGGIGKGFAVDRLVSHFQEWDFHYGLIESAGSAYVAMKTPDGEVGWELDIGYGDSTRSIILEEGDALASSGEFFQGAHVIDPIPHTKANPWKRSYAFARNGALADAASTASLLLDTESLATIVKANAPLSFALYSETETLTCGAFFD